MYTALQLGQEALAKFHLTLAHEMMKYVHSPTLLYPGNGHSSSGIFCPENSFTENAKNERGSNFDIKATFLVVAQLFQHSTLSVVYSIVQCTRSAQAKGCMWKLGRPGVRPYLPLASK